MPVWQAVQVVDCAYEIVQAGQSVADVVPELLLPEPQA